MDAFYLRYRALGLYSTLVSL